MGFQRQENILKKLIMQFQENACTEEQAKYLETLHAERSLYSYILFVVFYQLFGCPKPVF